MDSLASTAGEHFRMEDGSYLVVPRKGSEADQLRENTQDGDIAFARRRKAEKLIGLLRPSGPEGIDEDIIKNAARLAALHLQQRRLVFDNKREGSFDLSFRILPSPLRVSLSVKPAARSEADRCSLRPSAKRAAARITVAEINELVEKGSMREAVAKARAVHSLPTELRGVIAGGVLAEFARLGREIREEQRFSIPRLLAAHRTFRAVLDQLKRYVEPDALPSFRGTVALTSIRGDLGQGRDILADILSVTGHRVTDLGANMAPEEIVRSLKKGTPETLRCSSRRWCRSTCGWPATR